MSIAEIIRAWKDEEYRNSLTPEQLKSMPEHPLGLIELEDVESVSGNSSRGTCGGNTCPSNYGTCGASTCKTCPGINCN